MKKLENLINELEEFVEMIESDLSIKKGQFKLNERAKTYAKNIKGDLELIIRCYKI